MAAVSSRPGAIRANAWQHVAAVVRRGRNETRLYVNGNLVAKGAIGAAQFDDPKADLQIGNLSGTQPFRGELADVRLYRRPLEEPEILALVQPGKQLVQPPTEKPRGNRKPQPPELTLNLGDRQFSGALQQPAFLVVRLEAGTAAHAAQNTDCEGTGSRGADAACRRRQELAKRFLSV